MLLKFDVVRSRILLYKITSLGDFTVYLCDPDQTTLYCYNETLIVFRCTRLAEVSPEILSRAVF